MTHEPITKDINAFDSSLPPIRKPFLKTRLIRHLIYPALTAGILAGAYIYWSNTTQAPSASGPRKGEPPPVAVSTARVQKGDLPIYLNGLGTVVPLITTTVRTQLAGRLTEVSFKEGDIVRAGDFLAEVDPRPYKIALAQYEGQLRRDQALLQGAEKDLARYSMLVGTNAITKQQYDNADMAVGQYRGAVLIDQALVDNARLNLDYCRIVAPVGGRLGLRQVDLGNYVQATDGNGIVTITQLQPITVTFTVPQDDLPAILRQVRAGSNLQVTAFDRTGASQLEKGELIAIDNQIDPGTGTVKLKASFANTQERLYPNQFVNTQLSVDVLKGALIAPRSAVQRGAPGTFVYAVNSNNNTVSVKPVKLGPAYSDRIAIESGLAEGDTVVIDGADRLREGARILPGSDAKPREKANSQKPNES